MKKIVKSGYDYVSVHTCHRLGGDIRRQLKMVRNIINNSVGKTWYDRTIYIKLGGREIPLEISSGVNCVGVYDNVEQWEDYIQITGYVNVYCSTGWEV